MEIRLHLWPARHWWIWRVDDTVCDWTLFAGPLALVIRK